MLSLLMHILGAISTFFIIPFDDLANIGERALKAILWILNPKHLIVIAAIVIGGLTLFCMWIAY